MLVRRPTDTALAVAGVLSVVMFPSAALSSPGGTQTRIPAGPTLLAAHHPSTTGRTTRRAKKRSGSIELCATAPGDAEGSAPGGLPGAGLLLRRLLRRRPLGGGLLGGGLLLRRARRSVQHPATELGRPRWVEHGVLEALERGDAGPLGRLDPDLFAGRRIAAHAGRPLHLGELGEPGDRYRLPLGHRGRHHVGKAPKGGVDALRLLAGLGRYSSHEVSAVHPRLLRPQRPPILRYLAREGEDSPTTGLGSELHGLPDVDATTTGHPRQDAEIGRVRGAQMAHDVELPREAAGLWTRGHHAAPARPQHVELHLTEHDPPAHPSGLDDLGPLGLDQP